MINQFGVERWKEVVFDFEFCNDYKLEVSSHGRLRTFNKFSDGKLLNGSLINGYKIIRLKFFTERHANTTLHLNNLQAQIKEINRQIKELQLSNAGADTEALHKQMLELKKTFKKDLTADVKKRTRHYHSLVHRLVAEYFLNKPSEQHTIVAHLDYNKLNNQFSNLKWMTPEENIAHQQKSPYVIARKSEDIHQRRLSSNVNKLTVTKVMLLKKLLNQGKPLKSLVKQFKVTETQIRRIKKGENWGDIEAAK